MQFPQPLRITALALVSPTHEEEYWLLWKLPGASLSKSLFCRWRNRPREGKGLLQCHAVNWVTVAKLGLLTPDSVLPHPQDRAHWSVTHKLAQEGFQLRVQVQWFAHPSSNYSWNIPEGHFFFKGSWRLPLFSVHLWIQMHMVSP